MKTKSQFKLSLRIQGLPPTTNKAGYGHWAKKAKEVKRWRFNVVAVVGTSKPKSPLKKAKLTLIRCSSKETDFDNLVISFKPVVDGLKDAGIISDDRSSVIGQPTYLWKKERPTMGHIIIEVEGIE